MAVSSLWAASFLLTYTFPALNHRFGTAGTFLIYGLIRWVGFLLVAVFVPETKGRTLEQIESDSEVRASRQAAPSAGN